MESGECADASAEDVLLGALWIVGEVCGGVVFSVEAGTGLGGEVSWCSVHNRVEAVIITNILGTQKSH